MQIAKMPLDFASWMRTAVLSNQTYFEPEGLIDSPTEPGPLESCQIVDLCVQRMKERGIRPIAVDLTRSDVLVHAVRAIAPGMRSTRNQRGPGRLYTVPVQLGWLQKAWTEAELNPINCVL
jgi:ribosomal protein S12 methylthiotransferase accessory factor